MRKVKSIAIALCALLLGIIPSVVSAHPSSAPAPTVTGVSPNQGYNYQPTTITISGSDFVATPTARLNNVPLTNVTFVDNATLTATVPADLPGGAYTITVANPDSQSASLASAFTMLMSGDGALGNWQITTPMTTPRGYHAAVVARGFLYALGGTNDSGVLQSSVERATINANGSLGLWQAVTSMNFSRWRPAAVTVGSYIYVLGGSIGACCDVSSSVERAEVNPDGSLGSWQTMTSMTTARHEPSGAVIDNYIYVLGGQNGSGGYLNSVERAAINSDATLGSWQTVSSMLTARRGLAATSSGGYCPRPKSLIAIEPVWAE
jgi:N-acetylneuraminic acid mutarotase